MSIKKQRVHLATFVRFRYVSLLANVLRDVKERRLKFPILGKKFEKTISPRYVWNCQGFS